LRFGAPFLAQFLASQAVQIFSREAPQALASCARKAKPLEFPHPLSALIPARACLARPTLIHPAPVWAAHVRGPGALRHHSFAAEAVANSRTVSRRAVGLETALGAVASFRLKRHALSVATLRGLGTAGVAVNGTSAASAVEASSLPKYVNRGAREARTLPAKKHRFSSWPIGLPARPAICLQCARLHSPTPVCAASRIVLARES
jgi:hypothetical protein